VVGSSNLSGRAIQAASQLESKNLYITQANRKIPGEIRMKQSDKNEDSILHIWEANARRARAMDGMARVNLSEANPFEYPHRILVSDKPLGQGGEAAYLSISELEKKFAFKYIEDLIVPASYQKDVEAISLRQEPQSDTDLLYDKKKLEAAIPLRISKPHESLAICYIEETVGYGVFALEDIPEGEMLCIYAGKVSKGIVDLGKTEYGFRFPDTDLGISSKKAGGIARFFSHLPTNQKDQQRKISEILDNPKLLAESLKRKGVADEIITNIVSKRDFYKQFFEMDKVYPHNEYDELNNLVFSKPFLKKEIACANLSTALIKIYNKPYIAFITNRLIKRHEILGFDYSWPYWFSRRQFPLYLTKEGQVIPKKNYSRKEIFLFISNSKVKITNELFFNFFNRNALFFCFPESGRTVYLSLYELRKYASDGGLISSTYAPVSNNSFALALIENFAKTKFRDIVVETFLRKPEGSPEELSTYTADVVVNSGNTDTFVQLTQFFKPIAHRVKAIQFTNEWVIKDVNGGHTDLHRFVQCT
jgi:hypothetical protein